VNPQGRRIKKSLLIKITSIRFLKPDEIADLKKIDRIAPLLSQREKEIEANTLKKQIKVY